MYPDPSEPSRNLTRLKLLGSLLSFSAGSVLVGCERAAPARAPEAPSPTEAHLPAQPIKAKRRQTSPSKPQESATYGVRCGSEVCEPTTQLCCLDKDSSYCISQREESDEYSECYWGTQACDDSDDCAPGSTCYPSPTETARSRCEPSQGVASDWYEACTENSTCRTPGTSCEEGVCKGKRPPDVRISCGDTTCTGEQVCCVRNANRSRHCAASCTVEEFPIACRDKGDCPPGELCLIAPVGHQTCGKLNHGLDVACSSDIECPGHPVCQLRCIEGSCECP